VRLTFASTLAETSQSKRLRLALPLDSAAIWCVSPRLNVGRCSYGNRQGERLWSARDFRRNLEHWGEEQGTVGTQARKALDLASSI
jgi:hypothetical protein